MSAEPDADARVAAKAVEAGLVTEAQLTDVRRELARQKTPPTLSDALIAKGLLTRRQVEGFRSGDLSRRIGKYRLLRELGRGGMGVVYEAEDVELERRCALKTMIEAEGTDPRERAVEEERFVREARLSANLPRHPGIVGVYDAGVVDGRRVIAMELVEGLQFQDWRRKATFKQQIQALKDVADAVAHAHEHGVIHRDLKPSNILVDAQRKPRVTDFGLAKRSRETTVFSLTASGLIVGTPTYMSPEQAEAKEEVGPSTDQWALGVMLYEILAGRPPFRGDSAVDILMKTVRDPVVPPAQVLRGKVDERLERLCMRALKKDPAARFPSVRAFADQLGGWLKGGKPRAAAPPKRPAWIPIAVGAGAVAVLLLGWLFFRSPEPKGIDVPGLVAEGRRLMAKEKYADALIAFGRAVAADPENEAARAGKREAERLLTAARPDPAVVAALRKRIDDGDVAAVREKVDVVPEPARTELKAALRKRMEALLPGLRDRAVAAKRKGDAGQAEALAREVEAWSQPDLAAAMKAALAAEPGPAKAPAPAAGKLPRVHDLPHGENGVTALAFSPDGKRLFSGSFGGLLNVWDLEAARPLRTEKRPQRSAFATFSRDGRWIAVGTDTGDIHLYDAKTLQSRVLKIHSAQTLGVAFLPDSSRFVTASVDGGMRVWTLPEGVPGEELRGYNGGAFSLALSPDGKTAAVGSAEGDVALVDLPSWTRTETLAPPEPGRMMTLAVSPDGRRLAGGGEAGRLWIWDLKTLQRRDFAVLTPPLNQVAWSPDGRWLAAASKDDALRIYDATTGALKAGLPASGWWSCAFSPDGRWLAGGAYESRVCIYDVSALGR